MDFFQINFIIIIIFMLSLSKIHYSRCHLVSNWFGPPTELRWLSLKPLSISLLFVSSTNSKTNDLSLLHFALMLCDSHIFTSHQYNCFSGMSLCKYLNFVFESMYLLLSSSISKCLWVFTVQLLSVFNCRYYTWYMREEIYKEAERNGWRMKTS